MCLSWSQFALNASISHASRYIKLKIFLLRHTQPISQTWFMIYMYSRLSVLRPTTTVCKWSLMQCYTVKPILKDHCHERPPIMKDQIFLAEGQTFPCDWTCLQRPPILRDHICMANGVVFQDRFYCMAGGLKMQVQHIQHVQYTQN